MAPQQNDRRQSTNDGKATSGKQSKWFGIIANLPIATTSSKGRGTAERQAGEAARGHHRRPLIVDRSSATGGARNGGCENYGPLAWLLVGDNMCGSVPRRGTDAHESQMTRERFASTCYLLML